MFLLCCHIPSVHALSLHSHCSLRVYPSLEWFVRQWTRFGVMYFGEFGNLFWSVVMHSPSAFIPAPTLTSLISFSQRLQVQLGLPGWSFQSFPGTRLLLWSVKGVVCRLFDAWLRGVCLTNLCGVCCVSTFLSTEQLVRGPGLGLLCIVGSRNFSISGLGASWISWFAR